MKTKSIIPLCALHLSLFLVACGPPPVLQPSGTPTVSPTPTPTTSPLTSPTPTSSTSPAPGSSPVTSPVPTTNPSAATSTSVTLPNGSKLVISLGNRFLEAKGQTIQLITKLTDANGNEIPVSSLKLLFSSDQPQSISVDDKGLITALLDQGFAYITVVVDGTDIKATQLVSVNAIDVSAGGGGGGGPQPTATPLETLRVNVNYDGLNVFAFQANQNQVGAQNFPDLAMDADGNFVVTWASENSTDSDIRAQRYDSGGMPQGGEFQVATVNSYTSFGISAPSIAMNDEGDFVITWSSTTQDSDGLEVFAQRFDSQGISQGDSFQVNTSTSNQQFLAQAAMDDDGDFVIIWETTSSLNNSFGFFGGESLSGQRFTSLGIPVGSEFLINTENTSHQVGLPKVAMDDDGDFIVTWHGGYMINNNDMDVYAKRYDSLGIPASSEFQVNEEGTSSSFAAVPDVAMDDDGDFIIAWTNANDIDEYSDLAQLVQRYNSAGVPVGSEFQANSGTERGAYPSVAMDADGDFVVSWINFGNEHVNAELVAQRFNRTGSAQGSTITVFAQSSFGFGIGLSSIGMDADGDFAIPTAVFTASGDNSEIYVKRYDATGQLFGNPGQDQ